MRLKDAPHGMGVTVIARALNKTSIPWLDIPTGCLFPSCWDADLLNCPGIITYEGLLHHTEGQLSGVTIQECTLNTLEGLRAGSAGIICLAEKR